LDYHMDWKQRFQNYDKAFNKLTEFIEKGELSKFEVQGLIQCFEYTFELGCKTMKEFLEETGLNIKSPRETIEMAFSTHLIKEGLPWFDALNKRNLMAHTSDDNAAEEVKQLIYDSYYMMLATLRNQLSASF